MICEVEAFLFGGERVPLDRGVYLPIVYGHEAGEPTQVTADGVTGRRREE